MARAPDLTSCLQALMMSVRELLFFPGTCQRQEGRNACLLLTALSTRERKKVI